MADIVQLKTASYKGIEFPFIDMPTTGGNRIVKFNYPGSDKQSIEVQGKKPRTFNITAVIPHEGYYGLRDSLLNVLEDSEPGVLVHPTFGDIPNVINDGYTLSESINTNGRAEIAIVFEVDDAAGVPVESGVLPSQVQQDSQALNTQITSDLGDNYDVSLDFPSNFTDAIENLSNVTEAFAGVAEFTNTVAEQASEFSAAIRTFSGKINELITSPADMAESIAALFEDVDNLFETPGEAYGALRTLFKFGDDDPEIMLTTVSRAERKRNRDLIRSNMRTQSLSYAYSNAAQVTYESTDALDEVLRELEEQYVDVREDQLVTNAALEQLDRLRVTAQKVADIARLRSSSIITITTKRVPLSVLCYRYYGSTELFETIAEINDINQNAFVEGEVRILTV